MHTSDHKIGKHHFMPIHFKPFHYCQSSLDLSSLDFVVSSGVADCTQGNDAPEISFTRERD